MILVLGWNQSFGYGELQTLDRGFDAKLGGGDLAIAQFGDAGFYIPIDLDEAGTLAFFHKGGEELVFCWEEF